MKIALSGSSGTGRNIIAQRLAQELKVDLVPCVTRQVLREEKYDYSSGVRVEKFLARPDLQLKIFKYRKELEAKSESLVTDRSWVDQAAYGIIELYDSTEFDLDVYTDDCRDMAKTFDLTIYVPWNVKPLTHNGVRTLNPYYQLVVDSVIFNLLHKWEVNFVVVPEKLSINETVTWVKKEVRRLRKD